MAYIYIEENSGNDISKKVPAVTFEVIIEYADGKRKREEEIAYSYSSVFDTIKERYEYNNNKRQINGIHITQIN